ncbi:MAG TPA: cysteine desulfurase family protein [Candidatus Solibacter sp.]|nr:cysteine desulfurase family protein [Candidatus Solibacter sp.]
MNRVYLDYNATTPVDPQVLDAMLPYFSADFANASSIHSPGQRARAAVETAREQVAALIGAKPQEIVFTSGGTESDNHAIFGGVNALITRPINYKPSSAEARERRMLISHGKHIITTMIEHEAVLNSCQELEMLGVQVTYLAVDRDGRVDPESVFKAIQSGRANPDLPLEPVSPTTTLISVMHANNELGTVQPLEEIGRIARQHKIYSHADAVQSAGKIPIDVNTLNVDLLSLSGHKLYAPKGVGALYIRSGTRLKQFLYGGHHQRGARPGTENVAGIVGLGKAAEIARISLAADAARISALRDRLERGILERIPKTRVNAVSAPRTPNTTNIQFAGIRGEALVIALDLKGLACSAGAACSSGAVEPSHVLTAIGLSQEEAKSSLRFSLGRHTTESEIDFALEVIPAAVAQLRAIAPTYRKEAASHV